MHDAGKRDFFYKRVEINLHTQAFETQIFCRIAQSEKRAAFPCGFGKVSDLLKRKGFAVELGDDSKAGWSAVFGIGLDVIRKIPYVFHGLFLHLPISHQGNRKYLHGRIYLAIGIH